MANLRFEVVAEAFKKRPVEVEAPKVRPSEYFAKYVFNRQKMFYWEQKGKSVAEIDYLEIHNMKITPIEIKSGTQGGMKSLWLFMREKKLTEAFRCSLENFGAFDYIDRQDDDAIRHVTILPLYALSLLRSR